MEEKKEDEKVIKENEFRWEIQNFAAIKAQYTFKEKKYLLSSNFCCPPHLEW
jgi:hypothetical protein